MICAVLVVIQVIGFKYLTQLIAEKETFFNTQLSENFQDSLENLMNIYINNEKDSQIDKINKTKNQKIMKIETIIIYSYQFLTLFTYGYGIYLLYDLLKTKQVTNQNAVVILLIWVNSLIILHRRLVQSFINLHTKWES